MSSGQPLQNRCEVRRRSEAIFRDKGNGTKVRYHIFPEYEVHENEIAPQSTQEWHHHKRIVEALYIKSGSIEAHWVDSDESRKFTALSEGDMIDVGATVHTFKNLTDEPCHFLVFRLVSDGIDKREIIKNDRYSDIVDE